MKPNVRKLIDELAEQEARFRDTRFLAPCVRGGQVRTRLAGLVCTFHPRPRNFEGWGIFKPSSDKAADVVEHADLPLIDEYLRLLKPLRVRLAHVFRGTTWLAYPTNESDARQRCGMSQPFPVHLVSDGARFEQVVARWDGTAFWFADIDRRADPTIAEGLREALHKLTLPENLRFKGLTPEMRTVYDLATQQVEGFQGKMQHRREEARLRDALRMGGGDLREVHDRGDYWLVEWRTRDGEQHNSAIAKSDLTVISAGICLSERDGDFDLQSLVGVFEGRWD